MKRIKYVCVFFLFPQKIPVTGWCTSHCLYKNDKPKLRGTIILDLSIGAAAATKLGHTSFQDRKHLLRIILQHELKLANDETHVWRGRFSDLGEAIIVLSGHTSNSRAHILAQWSEFTTFHTMYPLPFELFENLLLALLPILKCHETATQEEINIFWDGVKEVLPSCFWAFRNIQRKSDSDTSDNMKMITACLSIVSTINQIQLPTINAIELFPKKIYGWLDKSNGNVTAVWSISSAVEEAIRSRAQDYLLEIAEFRFVHQENIECNLRNIIKVMEFIEMDLQQATNIYNKPFKE